ncbi:hypothetical protein DCO16_03685 [Polynucleobacter antarcticus]|uniref:Acetyltransferase (GNAT) domain-containing protein n=1 Tax=Polynucleobacter antarcticus TaxID=1743162 RepID=A0A6M9PTY5_9BURK|nr:hypothetical protein [Polynucleobacter antarcticus]QKM62255.1 hypothetical protein DCO16_03685 [Polynucleobacter antarcticus]
MARAAAYPDKMNPIGNSVGYDIRPIQPDDRDRMIGLFNHLSPHSRYLRFAHAVSQLPDDFLEDILHLDYKNELALVAVIQTKNTVRRNHWHCTLCQSA